MGPQRRVLLVTVLCLAGAIGLVVVFGQRPHTDQGAPGAEWTSLSTAPAGGSAAPASGRADTAAALGGALPVEAAGGDTTVAAGGSGTTAAAAGTAAGRGTSAPAAARPGAPSPLASTGPLATARLGDLEPQVRAEVSGCETVGDDDLADGRKLVLACDGPVPGSRLTLLFDDGVLVGRALSGAEVGGGDGITAEEFRALEPGADEATVLDLAGPCELLGEHLLDGRRQTSWRCSAAGGSGFAIFDFDEAALAAKHQVGL